MMSDKNKDYWKYVKINGVNLILFSIDGELMSKMVAITLLKDKRNMSIDGAVKYLNSLKQK